MTTNHNISDIRFKILVAKVAELIRYQGEAYIQEIEEVNKKYDTVNSKFLSEKEFHNKQIDKFEQEYSDSQI